MPLFPPPAGAVKKVSQQVPNVILPEYIPPQTEMGSPNDRITELSTKVTQHFSDLHFALTKALGDRVTKEQARDKLFMTSPDGSVWQVTVTNGGGFLATKVYST